MQFQQTFKDVVNDDIGEVEEYDFTLPSAPTKRHFDVDASTEERLIAGRRHLLQVHDLRSNLKSKKEVFELAEQYEEVEDDKDGHH